MSSSDKKRWIARPGCVKAERAVRKREQDGIGDYVPSFAMMGFTVVGAFMGKPVLWQLLVYVGVGIGLLAWMIGWPASSLVRFRRLIAAGDIIELDPFFLETWDTLRNEQGVALSDAERNSEIRALFDAASDLKPKLARYQELKDEAELSDERLRTVAHIRARLLREVTELGERQELERELRAQLPSPDGVTPEEVESQLRQLRANDASKQLRELKNNKPSDE